MNHGPTVHKDGTVTFALWAPKARRVDLVFPQTDDTIPTERDDRGFFSVTTPAPLPNARYAFRVDGTVHPDPASGFQPEGVHQASALVDYGRIAWTDAGFEPSGLESLVLYELHVGTFTPEGSFDAAARRLAELAALGVTGVEVMPIAEFPGARNWGYDGVYLYAAQSTYGGPLGFARFVDAAHAAGLSVVLDLVFNHFGPEGNYSGAYAPYTTDRYRTPWGEAVNVDGSGSDEVREYYYGCVEHWMRDCHVDGFRLDAIHEIHDESAVPFLSELSERVERYSEAAGKRHLLIAESDLNDRRVVEPRGAGGRGMDAAWADDFHHAVHARLTGERSGYYADFGSTERIARALQDGWCYGWEYSLARGRHHGNDPTSLAARSFVFCTQNHDQVGNRMLGERLRSLVGREPDRAARALLLLAPYVPLLFMGQEYGEERPFLYFVDHSDAGLLEATREGRAREFAAFQREGSPPDPGASQTFERSVLAWPDDESSLNERALTRELISLRSRYDCFRPAAAGDDETVRRAWTQGEAVVCRSAGAQFTGHVVVSFGDASLQLDASSAAAEVVFSACPRLPVGARITTDDTITLAPYEVIATVSRNGRSSSTR